MNKDLKRKTKVYKGPKKKDKIS